MSDGDICLKFDMWVAWKHPNAAKRQTRKPEVEFRCAGPICLENGNSAVGYDIRTKFGLQVENGIPQRTT